MTETKNSPSLETRVRYGIERVKSVLNDTLDPELAEVRDTVLGPIYGELERQHSYTWRPSWKPWPRVLQVETPDKDYVSVRRIEGKRFAELIQVEKLKPLDHHDDLNLRVFTISFPLYPQLVTDDQIVVFAVPRGLELLKTPNAEKTKKELIKNKLVDGPNDHWPHTCIDLEFSPGYGLLVDKYPHLYDLSEWVPFGYGIRLAMKKGNSLFVCKGEDVTERRSFQPGNNPIRSSPGNTYIDNQETDNSIEQRCRIYERFGLLYVLQKGSGKKYHTERRSGVPQSSLPLLPVPVTA